MIRTKQLVWFCLILILHMGIERNKILGASLCQEFRYLQYFSLIGPRLPEQKAIPIPGIGKNTETRNADTINSILRAFKYDLLKNSKSQV